MTTKSYCISILIMITSCFFKVNAQKNIKTKAFELLIQKSAKNGASGKASGDNMIQFTNYSLASIFKELLPTESEIDINNPQLAREHLDISLKTRSISLEDGKEILIETLLKQYKLRMNRITKKQPIFILTLISKDKFKNTISNEYKKGGVSKSEESSGNQIILSHFTMDEFTKSLGLNLNVKIENQVISPNFHDFKITVSSMSVLQNELELIGLKLTKENKTLSVTVIE